MLFATVTAPAAVTDISGDVRKIDEAVGSGNSGRLVGNTSSGLGPNVYVDLDLNGFTLRFDQGGNGGPILGGAVSSIIPGRLEITYSRATINGSAGNTYTGTTLVFNSPAVSLAKSAGNALCGDISVTAQSYTTSSLVWTASNQISDASNVTLENQYASLNLAGHTDTINDLYMAPGSKVNTGEGGVLKVTRLFLNGVEQSNVAVIAGTWVTGSGWIEVGNSGAPPPPTAPPIASNPTPATGSLTVHPAYLPKLDWDDCSGATSYDVYLWRSTEETKPVGKTFAKAARSRRTQPVGPRTQIPPKIFQNPLCHCGIARALSAPGDFLPKNCAATETPIPHHENQVSFPGISA